MIIYAKICKQGTIIKQNNNFGYCPVLKFLLILQYEKKSIISIKSFVVKLFFCSPKKVCLNSLPQKFCVQN